MRLIRQSLSEAGLLLVVAAVLGVAADLAIPGGALLNRETVDHELGRVVRVHAWTPDEIRGLSEETDGASAPLLIDARSAEVFARGHPSGAEHLPHQAFLDDPRRYRSRVEGRTVVVFLEADWVEEARLMCQAMVRELGAARAGSVDGGFEAWRDGGFPIEFGEPD